MACHDQYDSNSLQNIKPRKPLACLLIIVIGSSVICQYSFLKPRPSAYAALLSPCNELFVYLG